MFTKTLVAATALASFVALAPVEHASAKTKIDIDVGIGFGGGYYGGGYYGGGYGVDVGYGWGGGISCHKGKKIVQWSGLHNVNAIDCSGPVYKYNARKFGNWYRVRVSVGGYIISVRHL